MAWAWGVASLVLLANVASLIATRVLTNSAIGHVDASAPSEFPFSNAHCSQNSDRSCTPAETCEEVPFEPRCRAKAIHCSTKGEDGESGCFPEEHCELKKKRWYHWGKTCARKLSSETDEYLAGRFLLNLKKRMKYVRKVSEKGCMMACPLEFRQATKAFLRLQSHIALAETERPLLKSLVKLANEVPVGQLAFKLREWVMKNHLVGHVLSHQDVKNAEFTEDQRKKTVMELFQEALMKVNQDPSFWAADAVKDFGMDQAAATSFQQKLTQLQAECETMEAHECKIQITAVMANTPMAKKAHVSAEELRKKADAIQEGKKDAVNSMADGADSAAEQEDAAEEVTDIDEDASSLAEVSTVGDPGLFDVIDGAFSDIRMTFGIATAVGFPLAIFGCVVTAILAAVTGGVSLVACAYMWYVWLSLLGSFILVTGISM